MRADPKHSTLHQPTSPAVRYAFSSFPLQEKRPLRDPHKQGAPLYVLLQPMIFQFGDQQNSNTQNSHALLDTKQLQRSDIAPILRPAHHGETDKAALHATT